MSCRCQGVDEPAVEYEDEMHGQDEAYRQWHAAVVHGMRAIISSADIRNGW
jgi:hypothetical protein